MLGGDPLHKLSSFLSCTPDSVCVSSHNMTKHERSKNGKLSKLQSLTLHQCVFWATQKSFTKRAQFDQEQFWSQCSVDPNTNQQPQKKGTSCTKNEKSNSNPDFSAKHTQKQCSHWSPQCFLLHCQSTGSLGKCIEFHFHCCKD